MEVIDMWKEVLIRSGQFTIEPTNVELDQDKFVVLVRDGLRLFNKYCPKLEKFNITVVGPGTGGVFTFTDGFTANGKTLGIPKMISDAIPISLFGVIPLSLRHIFGQVFTNPQFSITVNRVTEELVKSPFPTEYRKPDFFVPLQGDYDIEAYFNHNLVSFTDTDGIRKYRVDTVDDTEGNFVNFFDFITGKFMQALGRSRRAFTLEALPITTDADTLVSEGERKEDDARTRIIDNDHDFTSAW